MNEEENTTTPLPQGEMKNATSSKAHTNGGMRFKRLVLLAFGILSLPFFAILLDQYIFHFDFYRELRWSLREIYYAAQGSRGSGVSIYSSWAYHLHNKIDMYVLLPVIILPFAVLFYFVASRRAYKIWIYFTFATIALFIFNFVWSIFNKTSYGGGWISLGPDESIAVIYLYAMIALFIFSGALISSIKKSKESSCILKLRWRLCIPTLLLFFMVPSVAYHLFNLFNVGIDPMPLLAKHTILGKFAPMTGKYYMVRDVKRALTQVAIIVPIFFVTSSIAVFWSNKEIYLRWLAITLLYVVVIVAPFFFDYQKTILFEYYYIIIFIIFAFFAFSKKNKLERYEARVMKTLKYLALALVLGTILYNIAFYFEKKIRYSKYNLAPHVTQVA